MSTPLTSLTRPFRSPLLDMSNAEIRTDTAQHARAIILPAVGAGLTATAAIIVGQHAVPVVAQLLGGHMMGAPEALTAGVAAMGAGLFTFASVSFLRDAARAAGAKIPDLTLGRELVAARSQTLRLMRTCGFLVAPFTALALVTPSSVVAPLAALGAAVFAALHTASLSQSDAHQLIVLRDAQAKLPATEAA